MHGPSNGNRPNGRHAPSRALTCFACPGKQVAEWGLLPPHELRVLDNAKVCNEYEPRKTIYHAGNSCLGLYCVASGAVVIRKLSPGGYSMAVRIATAGDMLGGGALFAHQAYSTTAETLTQTSACFVPEQVVIDMVERNPRVAQAFLARLALALRVADEERLLAASMPVRSRLAHLLLAFRERFGRVNEDGTLLIDLPVARRDLAAMIGTRPETLARLLRVFRDEGVARFTRNVVTIPDLDGLLDEVGEFQGI